ncbi:Lipase 3 [anaerobic digester metagenome]|uniref:Lipase 3 n=1 Tax=anaerobic digester metagenome TaxID=1263854 RepID=A0A485M7C5_9ZZZZ
MFRRYLTVAVLIGAVCLLCGCSGFQNSLFECSMSMEHRLSKLQEKSVQAGGLTFSYLERSGPGETIVLLHGFGADKDNWVRFVRHLPKEYRVIAIDLPGHGSTTQDPQATYTIDYLTQGFADAVQALNLDRFHLAGNSMGGFVSVLYSTGNPDHVLSLCLIDPAGAASPQPSDIQLAIDRGENPLVPKSREDFDTLMAYGFHDRPFIPWPINNVLADRYIERSAFNEKMWNDIHFHWKDVVPYLGSLQMRVFLIWGDKDRVLHVSSVSVYQRHIPQVETVILKDCGHVPMLELPKITAGHYTGFLEKCSQEPRASSQGTCPDSDR